MIDWLTENRLINWLLVVGYVVFLVFAHEWFVYRSVEIMNSLSLQVYNTLIAVLAATAALGVLLLTAVAAKQKTGLNRSAMVFLLVVLTALVVHFFLFTEMNIEFIHAMEFGLLAGLIYPLAGRFGAAAIYSLPVMLFDEWYQYQVLFEWVEYFDFNDILLDLLGAGLVLSILKLFHDRRSSATPFSSRPEVYALLFMAVATMILLLSSMVVPYPDDAETNTWLVLNAIQNPYGFWREHPLIGSTYHVLEPMAGLVTVFSVCTIYLLMDPIRSEK